jgi:DNA polymerase-3 subunit epsilon
VHFAPIDVDFISRALRSLWGVALRGPALDTIRLAETLYHRQRWTLGHDGMQMITALGPLAAQAGLPVYSEHNALSDALTTAQLFLSQAMQMERQGEGTLRRLLKAGRCLR